MGRHVIDWDRIWLNGRSSWTRCRRIEISYMESVGLGVRAGLGKYLRIGLPPGLSYRVGLGSIWVPEAVLSPDLGIPSIPDPNRLTLSVTWL